MPFASNGPTNMGIRTRNKMQAEARKRIERERFRENYRKLAATMPRRCDTNQVGATGECLACGADNGEHCKAEEQSR